MYAQGARQSKKESRAVASNVQLKDSGSSGIRFIDNRIGLSVTYQGSAQRKLQGNAVEKAQKNDAVQSPVITEYHSAKNQTPVVTNNNKERMKVMAKGFIDSDIPKAADLGKSEKKKDDKEGPSLSDLKDLTGDAKDFRKERGYGYAPGDSFVGGAVGIQNLRKGGVDLGKSEKKKDDISAWSKIVQGFANVGEGTSKIIARGSDDTPAGLLASVFHGHGNACSAVSDVIESWKELGQLVNMIYLQDCGSEEQLKQAFEVGEDALKTAKNITEAIIGFKKALDPVSKPLEKMVPGLDVALSGVNLLVELEGIIHSFRALVKMNQQLAHLKAIKGDNNLEKRSDFHRKKNAKIANIKAVINDDLKRIDDIGPDTKNKKKGILKKRLEDRIKKLTENIQVLENGISDTGLSREDVLEYGMITELRDINKKRIDRGCAHFGTESLKIVGSLMTLLSIALTPLPGLAAPVALSATGTKVAASAVNLALPGARKAKQKRRDRTARKIAKGKSTNWGGDGTKSTAAKTSYRCNQVDHLIKLITTWAQDPQADDSEFNKLDSYMDATGVRKRALYANNGKPMEQLKMLLAAVQSRDF